MEPTRKMWISAGVVGVILVGGASVAAVASAGRIDQARSGQGVVVEKGGFPLSDPTPKSDLLSDGNPPGTSSAGGPSQYEPGQPEKEDDFVVSHEVNPTPEDVIEYWDPEKLEKAKPYPLPVITVKPTR